MPLEEGKLSFGTRLSISLSFAAKEGCKSGKIVVFAIITTIFFTALVLFASIGAK